MSELPKIGTPVERQVVMPGDDAPTPLLPEQKAERTVVMPGDADPVPLAAPDGMETEARPTAPTSRPSSPMTAAFVAPGSARPRTPARSLEGLATDRSQIAPLTLAVLTTPQSAEVREVVGEWVRAFA